MFQQYPSLAELLHDSCWLMGWRTQLLTAALVHQPPLKLGGSKVDQHGVQGQVEDEDQKLRHVQVTSQMPPVLRNSLVVGASLVARVVGYSYGQFPHTCVGAK